MKVYSLLVGINEYKNPRINPLRGCQADAELFNKTLQEKFTVAPENIKTLYNAEATRSSIINAFNTHLIDNLQNHPANDNVAIFYFSGHGSQSASPSEFWHIEPDHLDETLVCHDSRDDNTPDLRDKELRMLIHKLSQHCQHILIVLDCCHGGHGTRVLDENLESVRMASTDKTPRSLESYLFHEEMKSALQADGNLPLGKHIVLAGCQDFQLSRERSQGENNQVHGLFTYALCETLNALPYPVSYRELRTRIHTRVQQQQLSQSPQLEAIAGANDRESVLGGNIQPLNLLAFMEGNNWTINAGAIHGFSVGDQIALFEGQGAEVVSRDTELAPKVRIRQLSTFKSTVDIEDKAPLEKTIHYNGVVTRRNFKKTGISLQGDTQSLESVRELLAQDFGVSDAGHFLTTESSQPRYELHAKADSYYVTPVSDPRPLFKQQSTARAALEQLATMARWWQKLELENLQTTIPEDAIEIVMTYKGQEYLSEDLTLAYTLQADSEEPWQQPEFNIELRLKADYPKSLYCALLYFDGSTGDITGNALVTTALLTHKQSSIGGQVNAVPSVQIFEGNPIPLKIKDELHSQGVTKIQDYLKLIVSEAEFDASLLEQDGNELHGGDKQVNRGNSLDSTLQLLMDDAHYRSLDLKKTRKAADWTTKTITLTVLRPQEAQEVQPDRAIRLNTGEHLQVQVEPHPAFRGSVRLISTQNEASKNLSKTVDSSPALFTDPASIIDFSKGYQSDLGLDALEIFIDSGARGESDQTGQVSAKQPLNITLNHALDDGEYIVPYTHDGEYYLPVGYSSVSEDGQSVIHIEQLPESAATTAADTRSLGSALKIYFRKIIYRDWLGRDTAIHILGTPRFDEQNPTQVSDYQTDETVITSQVAKAEKILLVIHGIIGESRTMVGFVNHSSADGKCLHDDYDLVIGFDYENLNSRIQDIAQALKQALADVGITPESGKQVDIVAHSMGGLVSRWFIEREGGDSVIRKLVMVGTPNGGSPYADVKTYGYDLLKTWAYSNLVIALNGLIPSYASGAVVGGFVKLLDSVDNTLDQMSPDSDFIKEIQFSQHPSIPYALIAGHTDTMELTESNSDYRIARLFDHLKQRAKLRAYDLLTDKLFKEANDVAVSFSSMTQFNSEWRDEVAVEQVGCDHLSYFGDDKAVNQIIHHLTKVNY